MGRVGLAPGEYPLRSAEETLAFGEQAAKSLPEGTVLALRGNLGAGKTTFVQGLAQGLGIAERVQSPTFVLLHVYEGLVHFDLYRLNKSSDFTDLGFDEYLQTAAICAIEWPDRIADLLPEGTTEIDFVYQDQGRIAIVR